MIRRARLSILALCTVPVLLLGNIGPAHAASDTAEGQTGSDLWAFSTGSNRRTQHHNGDDILWDTLVYAGRPSMDMRWRTCVPPFQYGSVRFNITAAEGSRTIGSNFLAETCFVLQWRPFASADANKNFLGVVYWNFDQV